MEKIKNLARQSRAKFLIFFQIIHLQITIWAKFSNSDLTSFQFPLKLKPKISQLLPGIDNRLQLEGREFALIDNVRGERQSVPKNSTNGKALIRSGSNFNGSQMRAKIEPTKNCGVK